MRRKRRGGRKKGVLEEVDQLSLIMCMTIKGLIRTVNLKKETKEERKRGRKNIRWKKGNYMNGRQEERKKKESKKI